MKDSTRNLSYQSLVSGIFETIREKAYAVPALRKDDISLRVKVHPYTKEADLFFGGLGDYDRHQNMGPAGCITLPPDSVVYTFEKDLVAGSSETRKNGIINYDPERNIATTRLTVRKRKELNLQAEGKVFAQDDWAVIIVNVYGGQAKREVLKSINDPTEFVTQFFSDYNEANGYESDTFMVIGK